MSRDIYGEVCEHFVLIGEHCQDCEDAGRESRLKVQRGEEECPICGNTARIQDGGPANRLQDTLNIVREAIQDDNLSDMACLMAISMLVQVSAELTDEEREWARGVAKKYLTDEAGNKE